MSTFLQAYPVRSPSSFNSSGFSDWQTGQGSADVEIVRTKMADAHWSPFQMVAYQSSSGCGMHTGNLLGTGTLSSPVSGHYWLSSLHRTSLTLAIYQDRRPAQSEDETSWSSFGCLVEINGTGHKLPEVGGRPLTWLEDGDKLTIEGWFETADGRRAGFGCVSGLIVAANIM
jgi:fumarylacetoacetase